MSSKANKKVYKKTIINNIKKEKKKIVLQNFQIFYQYQVIQKIYLHY